MLRCPHCVASSTLALGGFLTWMLGPPFTHSLIHSFFQSAQGCNVSQTVLRGFSAHLTEPPSCLHRTCRQEAKFETCRLCQKAIGALKGGPAESGGQFTPGGGRQQGSENRQEALVPRVGGKGLSGGQTGSQQGGSPRADPSGSICSHGQALPRGRK